MAHHRIVAGGDTLGGACYLTELADTYAAARPAGDPLVAVLHRCATRRTSGL